MRLRRLDLTRYGCFTDFRVDFGERVPSVPDLHVIYGANESGKSTLLAAFLDLLYKIPKSRSRRSASQRTQARSKQPSPRFVPGSSVLGSIKHDNGRPS